MTDYDRRRYEEAKKAYAAFMSLYPLTLDNLPGEIWLPVPDYEDYHGSNFGRVKSFKNGKVKILKPALSQKGYLRVGFCKNGKTKYFHVHILVAKLFIPNPENKPEVDHVFDMKFDCSVWNLRWSTSGENKKYAVENGLIKLGEDNYQAKFTNEQVQYIRQNPDNLSGVEFSRMFEVGQITISDIQRGKTYKNAGGNIRESKYKIISDEMRTQILADYQKGVRGHGSPAVAKRFGVDAKTVLNIYREFQSATGSSE